MRILFIIIFFFFSVDSNSQQLLSNNTSQLDIEILKKRQRTLFITEASLYSISLFSLNELWYADYPRSSFHFINDNYEWLQMDKLGHLTTSYYSGVVGIKAYKWSGISRKKAIWYGGLTGTFFLAIIEVLDGYSAQWGASSGDLIANTSGSLLAISQELVWNEQRIQLKYSYFPTKWAEENPDQLGRNYLERLFKDYNGQTYWLTLNMSSLFNIKNNNFPSWLSLALGYSADKMLSPYNKKNDQRVRQMFLSFDVDLNRIKVKNKLARNVLHTFGFIKFPMPSLEYRDGVVFFHPIYY